MKPFILMLTFLTRIPLKVSFRFNDEDFRKGIWYIPVIGLFIGLVLYGTYNFLDGLMPPMVISFILVVLYLLITGGIHIDGLADTLDATASNRSRERMLEIMKDSHIGTFGVLGIIVWFAGMVILLGVAPWVCIVIPVAGRSLALFSSSISNYARENGMGKTIVDGTHTVHVIFSFFITALSVFLLYLFTLDFSIVLSVSVAFVIVFFEIWLHTVCLSKKLSGITGDVIGYIIELSGFLILLFSFLIKLVLE
ncbi:MAG: adenosylcobinamide-GDP ribazoletransferase [Clostridia bacterium]|nr:adenosylcobinamide-GDP ribazoletransferase [Clostridia bacterium]